MPSERRNVAERILRIALGALLIATCVRVWFGPQSMIGEAQAQIPDAGAQRLAQVAELRQTNQLLADVLATLRNDTLKVEIAGTDKKSAGPVRSRTVPGR